MAVVDVVERTASEISDLVAAGQFRNRAEARYKQVEKGAIRGSGVMSLSEAVIASLWRRADYLLAANPLALDISGLHRLFTEANKLPHDAREVMKACEAGQALFAPENLKLMAMLPMPQRYKDALPKLTVDTLDAHVFQRPHRSATDNDIGRRSLSRNERDLKKRLEAIQRDAKRQNR
jgi:hypothetical protein